jgi:hypothetical protein
VLCVPTLFLSPSPTSHQWHPQLQYITLRRSPLNPIFLSQARMTGQCGWTISSLTSAGAPRPPSVIFILSPHFSFAGYNFLLFHFITLFLTFSCSCSQSFDRCEVILLAPVAILTAARTSLLASKRDADIVSYFRRSQSFDMKVLCSILTRLLGNTEAKHLTGRPLFEFSF